MPSTANLPPKAKRRSVLTCAVSSSLKYLRNEPYSQPRHQPSWQRSRSSEKPIKSSDLLILLKNTGVFKSFIRVQIPRQQFQTDHSSMELGPVRRMPEIRTSRKRAQCRKYNILILGASYGSLLASKILFGGHSVKLVCLPGGSRPSSTRKYLRVRLPVKGRRSRLRSTRESSPEKCSAAGAADVDPSEFDLIGLAMQEPQYGSAGVRQLLDGIAQPTFHVCPS